MRLVVVGEMALGQARRKAPRKKGPVVFPAIARVLFLFTPIPPTALDIHTRRLETDGFINADGGPVSRLQLEATAHRTDIKPELNQA